MAENINQSGEEVMKEILIGVTENCVSESKTPEKVRNTLVNSIAANIFDTLKCNDDIAQILVGVLDPSRTDKDALMKNLMSKVNSTLQDSLLRNARGCSLNSDGLTPENSESMRSSTISSSSVSSGQTSGLDKNPRQYDGFETAESDFVYESSCSMETKKYEMGKHVEKHEIPLTVHELSKSISVPICVEDWVASNSNKIPTNNSTENLRPEQTTTASTRSEQTTRYVNTTSTSATPVSTSEHKQTIPVKITTTSRNGPTNMVTSLPPLPRSQSATFYQERTAERTKESKSTQFTRNNEMSEVSVMEPLEVKIKTAPKKQTPNFPQNAQTQNPYNSQNMQTATKTHHQNYENIQNEQQEEETQNVSHSFSTSSSISNNSFQVHNEKNNMKNRVESRRPQDSLLVQVQGPDSDSSLDTYKHELSPFTCQSSNSDQTITSQKINISEDTIKNPPPAIVIVKEENNEGYYFQVPPRAADEASEFRQEHRSDSRQSQRSLSPLSVGPIPSPIDPVQEEKAQETFDKLYEKMKNNGEDATGEVTQSAKHSSETIRFEKKTETTFHETESRVHIVPISLVDKVNNIEEFIDIDKVNNDQEMLQKNKERKQMEEESIRTTMENKSNKEQDRNETENMFFDKNEAKSYQNSSNWKESKTKQNSFSESKLPPLEDPSIILLSPTPIKRSTSFALGSDPSSTNNEIFTSEDDYMELESLAEEVKNIKEDKAAAFLHDKLKDNISDMIAYEKHNRKKDNLDAQGKPLNHFCELKQKQDETQKEFHKKLFNELQREVGETKNSAVADALGTKFEIKVQPNQEICQTKISKLSHSKSTNQIYETNEQKQGSLSVPSKSPDLSRRGSFSNTYMSKGAFWSNSLPRAKRRVTFVDEAPQRPPPPAPVRQQSIHTMKDFTNVTQIYNQTLEERKQQILNPQTKTNEQERTEKTPSSAGTSLNNLQSVEFRSYSKTRNMKSSEKEDEYKLDLGERKDPWVELYGNSVLNNTLQDRIEQHKLQKSQSAVWNKTSGPNEIMEHAPVTSTDKLEKPKKVDPAPIIDISPCQPSITTLPRRSSHSIVAGGTQQTNLRRNSSMSDLSRQNTFNKQYTNSDQRSPMRVSEPQNETLFQVPPSIVRGIVKTVLQNQGITNPSEEILNKAIQEYYSKNPQGVSVNSNLGHANSQTHTTRGQNKSFTESEGYDEDFKRNVDNQPYRTSPLVTPAPRTITESGSGARTYQQFRGPQYNPTPRQPTKNVPLYMRGASSMSNLNTQESYKTSETTNMNNQQTISTSAQNSPETPVRMNGKPFVRQTDTFSNYKTPGNNSLTTDNGAHVVMKNNSINQSKSFKKVMADVLRPGETEF